jgi:hypothetical protein
MWMGMALCYITWILLRYGQKSTADASQTVYIASIGNSMKQNDVQNQEDQYDQ